jgi:hypothetical protein
MMGDYGERRLKDPQGHRPADASTGGWEPEASNRMESG